MKKIGLLILTLAILIFVIVLVFNDVIFQEGNPLKLWVAIAKLNLTTEDMIKFDDKPMDKYVIKFNKDDSGYGGFIKFKEAQGWKLIDRVGSGLVFEKDGVKKTAVSRKYTRWYRVIYDFIDE